MSKPNYEYDKHKIFVKYLAYINNMDLDTDITDEEMQSSVRALHKPSAVRSANSVAR